MVIIARSMGRLGNQIFQVAAALSVRKEDELYIGMGFEQFMEVLPEPLDRKMRFLTHLNRRHSLRIHQLCLLLSRLGVFGKIDHRNSDVSQPLVVKSGLLPVKVMFDGYPNSERLFNPLVVEKLFGLNHLLPVRLMHGDVDRNLDNKPKCFIHVRRTDFLSWPSISNSAATPIDWFVKAIDVIERDLGPCKFVLLSDDITSLDDLKPYANDMEIFDGDIRTSIEVMLSCDAGILSPSTFSWWVAWIGSRRGMGPYIAPEFWTNWRQGYWEPWGLRSEFLRYLDV